MEENKNLEICFCCGEEFEEIDMYEVDGKLVCNSCYLSDVVQCECCEEEYFVSDMISIHNCSDEVILVCNSCCDDRSFYCDYHDREEVDTSSWEDDTVHIIDYGVVCREGFEWGDFCWCSDCEEYYHVDNMTFDDESEEYYCLSCYDEYHNCGYITSYHDHDYDEKFMVDGEKEEETLLFGIELEVEQSNRRMTTDRARMSEILYNMDFDNVLAFEHDSSLHNGFEIITQPMSFEYIKENRQFFMDMMESLRHNGYESFDTNTCGHHIHMSKMPLTDRQQVLFVAVFEFFRQEFTVLSRREESKLERWATFITRNYDKDQLNNSEVFESLLNILLHQCNRYRAINVCNTHTLESRIWRGTLDSLEYLARIELMYNIAMYVKDHTEELYEMVFDNSDLFELNLYDIVTYKSNEFIIEYLSCNGFMSVVNTKLSMSM